MRVERHPAVITDDLPQIYAYIAHHDQAAAERVLDAVDATFREIAAQPGIGVDYPPRTVRLRDVRMIPVSGFSDYLVFYRAAEDAVRVLYVVHGARHLPRLFRRDPRD